MAEPPSEAGAVQVTVSGDADPADVKTAVDDSFDQLVKELHAA